MIAASEDIGNANPTALMVASNGMQACHQVGMPESRIILSQVVTYLAASPKSNRAYEAINKAMADVKNTGNLEIPMHLRNASTDMMKKLGYGKDYKYAHHDLEGARASTYLPDALGGTKYYIPSDAGTEKSIQASLSKLRPTKD